MMALLRLHLGLFPSVVVGQIRANSLSCRLIDTSGAVIREPWVTVTDLSSGNRVSQTTNADGMVSLTGLIAGTLNGGGEQSLALRLSPASSSSLLF
jgi:hypothetical protein